MPQINVDCRMGAAYNACCELFSDSFDGTNATVGNGWTEDDAAGWSRDAGELVAGTGAIFCYHAIDAGPPEHSIEARVKFSAVGQRAAILARFNLNLGCYLSLEVELDSADCAILRLKNNKTCDGGSDETLAQAAVVGVTLDEWHTLELCYRAFGEQDEAQLYGELITAAGDRVKLAATTTLPDADPDDYANVGVLVDGALDAAQIRFDDYVVEATESETSECCTYCYYGRPYDCLLLADGFDRDDADNLGCLWGGCENGSIVSNEALFETPNTYCAANYFSSIPAWSIVVLVKGDDDDDEPRGLVAIVDDDNYLFAQLTVDGACGNLKLFQRSGGTNTQLGSSIPIATAVPDAWHILRVCWDGSHLWAHVTTAAGEEAWYRQAVQIDPGAITSLGGIGVGVVTSAVRFDDFQLEMMKGVFAQLKHVDDCEDCRPDPLDCVIHQDVFTRDDSDDAGCYWEEVSGDHDIVSNALETMTAGVVISRLPNVYGNSDAYLTATAIAPDDADSAVFIVDYLDADNYHFVRVRWGVSGIGNADGDFMLYKREGGSNTALLDDPVTVGSLAGGDQASVTICFGDGLFEAIVQGASANTAGNASAETTAVGGDRGGLGGDQAGVRFTGFSFEYLFGEEGTTNCERCVTSGTCEDFCVDSEMPTQLKVVLDFPIIDFEHSIATFCDGGLADECPLDADEIPRTWYLDRTTSCVWCKSINLAARDCSTFAGNPLSTFVNVTVSATIDASGLTVTVRICDSLSDEGDQCETETPCSPLTGQFGCINGLWTFFRPFVLGGDDLGTIPAEGPDNGGLCMEWADLEVPLFDFTQVSANQCCAIDPEPEFVYVSAV